MMRTLQLLEVSEEVFCEIHKRLQEANDLDHRKMMCDCTNVNRPTVLSLDGVALVRPTPLREKKPDPQWLLDERKQAKARAAEVAAEKDWVAGKKL